MWNAEKMSCIWKDPHQQGLANETSLAISWLLYAFVGLNKNCFSCVCSASASLKNDVPASPLFYTRRKGKAGCLCAKLSFEPFGGLKDVLVSCGEGASSLQHVTYAGEGVKKYPKFKDKLLLQTQGEGVKIHKMCGCHCVSP